MSANNKIYDLEGVKEHIVNIFLAVVATTAILPVITSMVFRQTMFESFLFYMGAIAVLAIYTIYFIRKRLSINAKVISIIISLLFFSVIGLHFAGVISNTVFFMILAALFAALFLSRLYSFITLFITVIIQALYAYLYLNGILTYKYDVVQFVDTPLAWCTIILILIVFTIAIILIIFRLENAYRNLLAQSKKNESDYRLLFEQASEGIIISDSAGNIQLVNENFRRLSGYSNEELTIKNFSEFLIDEELKINPIRFDLLLAGHTLISERNAIVKNGELKAMEIRANMLPDGRLQLFVRDITEQKRMQVEMENERSFIKAIIDTMPGVFYVFEDYKTLVQWNDSMQKISGFTHDDLFNKSPEEIFHIRDAVKVKNGLSQAFNEGYAYFKANLTTKSGEMIPLYHTVVDYQREGQHYLVGVGYDISSLELTEAALKISEENFKNIYNNTSDAIFIFNQYFEILSANQTFFSLTGLSEEDVRILNIFDYIFDEKALQKVAREVKELNKGHIAAAEYMIRNKAGERFPVEVRSRKITYEGQPAVVTSFNDISSRKDLEKQVYVVSMKAEEEERGRIAKDLHDGLGPLLSTCKIYLHNLKLSMFNPNEKKSYKKLGELINESLIGVKEISNNLSPHILRNFGLIPALNSFIEKLSAYAQIRISCNFDAPNRYTDIIEITLYRISTELINNTLKHSEAENITISIKEENEKLRFVYVDDGKGFDYEEIMEEKKGLGLFNINSRINSIGGIIIFKSSKGKGVHVTIETNITS